MKLDYFAIEHEARRYMEYLNGRVNLIKSYYQSYEYKRADIAAGEHNGAIVFYCVPLMKTLSTLKADEWRTMLFCICVHELSHINQLIDYELYASSPEYKKEIERKNDIATYQWIVANMDEITKVFPEIDPVFVFRAANALNLSEETHKPSDVIDIMRYALSRFMIDGYQFDQFPSVSVLIHYPDRYAHQYAKYNNHLVNIPIVLSMIHSLYDYERYNVGKVIQGNEYCIYIKVEKEWQKLQMACYQDVPYFE